ncbi:hypothetical protein BS47DRAFT_1388362 [Hydnum rufescens UP504]|uniref:Uncharacterized protein n=1 Tax=Hydnum rufescens UP504 TaxID=1448309 RepID=A0A9P6B965_9AGAM|nr:hypothetical protein BS47DRAFT_1388362 [Hydnum rufescens UP504]
MEISAPLIPRKRLGSKLQLRVLAPVHKVWEFRNLPVNSRTLRRSQTNATSRREGRRLADCLSLHCIFSEVTCPRIFGIRRASSESHAESDHHDTTASDTQNEPETFGTSFWRNTIIIGVLVYGLDRYISSTESKINGEGVITRYIRNKLMVPVDVWTRTNETHTIMSEKAAVGKLLSQAAERPSIHRHRFPSGLDAYSPHLVPVGSEVDLSGVVIRR